LPRILGQPESLTKLLDDRLSLLLLRRTQLAVVTITIWLSNLFNEFEDVLQSALERLFVDGVIAS
jgi:hypothetical protein